MIATAPGLGVGPGNWPVFFPLFAEPGATADGVLTATLEPRQAHDDVLERTAETGVVAIAALIVLGLVTGMAARRRLANAAPGGEHDALAGASGSLVSLVALSVPGFPLEMPGTLMLGGLALGLVAARRAHSAIPDGRPAAPTRNRMAGRLLALAGVALMHPRGGSHAGERAANRVARGRRAHRGAHSWTRRGRLRRAVVR